MDMKSGKMIRALLWAATAAAAAVTIWLYGAGDPGAEIVQAPSGQAGQSAGAVLDINTAGTDALEELPGIGPALAERIIQMRDAGGPFDGPEALMEVPGIGPATWEDIEPFVYFGEQ